MKVTLHVRGDQVHTLARRDHVIACMKSLAATARHISKRRSCSRFRGRFRDTCRRLSAGSRWSGGGFAEDTAVQGAAPAPQATSRSLVPPVLLSVEEQLGG